MIGFYDYTVVATYLATVFGLMGIFQAAQGEIVGAVVLLLLTGLLDTVDGRIARTKKNRTQQEKQFGIQIDSLNDVICFGVLPGCIAFSLFRTWLGEVPVFLMACVCFYTLTGLIRLAYFNVTEEERQRSTSDKRKTYQGVPITAGTLAVPLFLLLGRLLPGARVTILSVGLLVTGLAFILPLRIPKPNLPGICVLSVIGAAELVGLFLLM